MKIFIGDVKMAKGFYIRKPEKKGLIIKKDSNTILLIYIISFFFIIDLFFEKLLYIANRCKHFNTVKQVKC